VILINGITKHHLQDIRYSEKLLIVFLAILLLPILTQSQTYLQDAFVGIEASVHHDYDQALSIFSHLYEQFPNDPIGPFFIAATLQSKMMDFETNKWQNEFYAQIENTEIRAKRLLQKDPHNAMARFFLGGALAYKGFYLARQKKYLSGIRVAIAAVNQLEKVVEIDSQMYDAYLGIGNYKYWRSRLTRMINWLPFFSDQREEGLRMIKVSLEKGTFTRWAALNDLAWIYIDREEPAKALGFAQMGLREFPKSRFFLWPAAEAYAQIGETLQARRIYEKLLLSVTSKSFNNHYNEILLHLKIAECAYDLREFKDARLHCEHVLTIEPDDEVKKRIESKIKKAKKLLNEIRRENPVDMAN
jgi:tetratricopeptide (TPR) repeat protein